MPRGMEVLRRVPVLRIVAAADVSARSAQPKMQPGVAHRETLLATGRVGRIGDYELEMAAMRRHGVAFELCALAPRSVRSRPRLGRDCVDN